MKTKLLVVEDSMIIALDIQQSLSNNGYEVFTAASGEQAVKKALEFEPDLIVMDIHLKGFENGIETAKKIRQHFSNLPVIYMTGSGDLIKKMNISDPCISKPFKKKELQQIITSLTQNLTSESSSPT